MGRRLKAYGEFNGRARDDGERNMFTDGVRNSVEDDVIPVTVRGQTPALPRVRGWSENVLRQTPPKLPGSARRVTSLGAGALPETWINFGLAGSLLKTVTIPAFTPKDVGRKRMGMSIDEPGPTVSG